MALRCPSVAPLSRYLLLVKLFHKSKSAVCFFPRSHSFWDVQNGHQMALRYPGVAPLSRYLLLVELFRESKSAVRFFLGVIVFETSKMATRWLWGNQVWHHYPDICFWLSFSASPNLQSVFSRSRSFLDVQNGHQMALRYPSVAPLSRYLLLIKLFHKYKSAVPFFLGVIVFETFKIATRWLCSPFFPRSHSFFRCPKWPNLQSVFS
jgi:hypothetical protein